MESRRTPRSRRFGRRTGLGLVELLVASGVLLVAGLSAFSSQVTSMNLMHQSRTRAIALTELEACMETLLMEPVQELPLPGSPFAHGASVAAYEDRSLPGERIVVTYPGYAPGNPLPDPLVIRITATWLDPRGGERSMFLTTAKAL